MVDARLEASHPFVKDAFKDGSRDEGKFLFDGGNQVIHLVEFSIGELLLHISHKKEI
jgi:hypothetical protein